MARKSIDITGRKFNKLTAIKFSHNVGDIPYWIFECECGNKKSIVKSKVVNGYAKSCGCGVIDRLITHGLTCRPKKDYLKSYRAWMAMKNRCHCPTSKAYVFYGMKGIFVCDEWHKFENFYKDMGDPPTKKHSIDRIDPSKGYSKDNCRWATWAQQSRNKLKNFSNKTTSKFKGVELLANGSYRARIGFNNRKISLGCFATEIDAAKAYNEAALKYHGDFSCINKL
jgi:hypothetical protein